MSNNVIGYSMRDITEKQWNELIANDADAVIVDVRTPAEWNEGIIENAQLINIMQPHSFMDAIDKLDKSKNYYVYCRSGGRSAQACQVMNSIGIQNTYNLLGGMMEWQGKTNAPNY